jgi:signal transduction histidine kinase
MGHAMKIEHQEVPVFTSARAMQAPVAPDGVPASVLVVDDNPAKQKAIVSVISRLGVDVTTANSGRDALRLLLKQDFAVILLDVKMPNIDGFETATLIHGRPRSAHTPVIFITAEADSDSERFLGYTMGAVDYILWTMQRKLILQTDELRESKVLLQQLASHQEMIKEEERKRIAREIHDELGQNLLALRIDASMLHARTGTMHPKLNEKAEYALKHIDATIKSVRAIINDLRPPVLDLGLQAAIEWQLKEFQRRSNIPCELVVQSEDFDRCLDEKRATALFRILQESLTNVTRHAKASAVRIEVNRDTTRLYMNISDNGIGMLQNGTRRGNSFGLQGIKERVRMLEGELKLESDPGCGTTLKVTIPLDLLPPGALQAGV